MQDETQPITFRLPADLYERLRIAAFERRVSMNQIVITAVEKELQHREERQ